jgi:hypothetical protein
MRREQKARRFCYDNVLLMSMWLRMMELRANFADVGSSSPGTGSGLRPARAHACPGDLA